MTGLRGGDHHLRAPGVRVRPHSVAYALAAALAVGLAVLVLVLATTTGGSSGNTDPVRVAPSSGPAPPQGPPPEGNRLGARP